MISIGIATAGDSRSRPVVPPCARTMRAASRLLCRGNRTTVDSGLQEQNPDDG
jgi:hypothetical protein